MGLSNGGDPDIPPHFYGGYGQYNYSPVKNLVKIPRSLDPTAVCVFACAGPTVMHAVRLTEQAGYNIKDAEIAVVQGLGPVGFFAVTYLASLGIRRIIAVTAGRKPRRDALALELGASEVLTASESGCVTGADLVVEASGNPAAIQQGLSMLRNRGVYLVPGQYSDSGGALIEPQLITFKALRIIGSSQYSTSDIIRYLSFMEENLRLRKTVLSLAAQYPVEDANRAIGDAGAGKNIKTLLVL
jgi:D-arabinose 1-dehydrogenase-like Zn-dependent alcohol dehydrogenase